MALIKGIDEKAAEKLIDEDKVVAGWLAAIDRATERVRELLVGHRLVITLEKKER